MTRRNVGLIVGAGFAVILCAPSLASAQTSPSLGTAGTYSVLAGSQVTNTGISSVNGDVGIRPGIPPDYVNGGTLTIGGTLHDADGAALTAQADMQTAYGNTAGNLGAQGCTVTYAGAFKELGGSNLVPGVYCATSFHLSGTLTLSGTASDTWIFKSSSDLVISGGAAAKVSSPSCNVWWRVVSTASFDAGSSLTGNILADTSVTMAAGATLTGRALARTAAVTLSSNAITACVAPSGGGSTTPTVSKAFSPAAIAVGGVTRLIITLNNPTAAAISLTSAFTDTLPTGVLIAASPNPATTCGVGAVAAPIGGSTVTLTSGSTIPSGSCTIAVNVIAAASGTYVNTIPAGALLTTSGSNASPASASLSAAAAVPPVGCATTAPELYIVKHHTDTFVAGINATYSIALFNSGPIASSGTITITDTLPTGLTFVSAAGTGWTCSATGQVVTCTTTAAVAAASPSPNNITLTVTPTAAAAPGVTNVATVTGGNDCNTTNNATADVTLVALAVPTLSEWAFILLAVLLASAGVVALRRRTAV
jgi:uncharacterized repeat protein (TIGR01451 family)